MTFQTYTLKLEDLASGQACVAEFPGSATANDILNFMAQHLMLRFPPSRCLIQEWPRQTPQLLLRDLGLAQEATLHIGFDTGLEEYLQTRGTLKNLYKTYQLNFLCTSTGETIRHTCRGYDRMEDVINRLIKLGQIPRPGLHYSYRIAEWSRVDIETYVKVYGGPGWSNFYSARKMSTYLCDIDPKDGERWWLYTHDEDHHSHEVQVLYGCPTAPEEFQKPELAQCTVEVIDYV